MPDTDLLSPWVRRFLLEHLVGERNLARNTQKSYRDTLQLVPAVHRRAGPPTDRAAPGGRPLGRAHPSLPAGFGREARLRSGHAKSAPGGDPFLGALHRSAQPGTPGMVRADPDHRVEEGCPPAGHLPGEGRIGCLAGSAGPSTAQGRRDHAVLLFLYNTGARADEVAHVRIGDLDLGPTPEPRSLVGLIHGKGNKLAAVRCGPGRLTNCSLWLSGRDRAEHVFLNRRGQPLTRFGIHALVERYAAVVAAKLPSVAKKRVSPHTIRHTTATHLLRAGVDINTIRAWLGHVSLSTTNVYAEVDLEMKAKALANCEIKEDEAEEALA